MNVADFDYDLPPDAIAQEPCEPRDAARLLVAGPGDVPRHHRFRDLPGLLRPGDLVVVNDTRVLPARLFATRPTGGRVEILLLEPAGDDWWCLLRAPRKPKTGERLEAPGGLALAVRGRDDDRFLVRVDAGGRDPLEVLEEVGRMPLPPYVRRTGDDPRHDRDRIRYQTVYARRSGAVAAPTAGLHFTPGVLGDLGRRGIDVASITLHVGAGTFRPVRVDRVKDHVMHDEWYDLPEATARAIDAARRRGGRIVAIGTTVARTLEHGAAEDGEVRPGQGRTDLFITPGHRFRAVDALVTNFHLPRSTLLMLVAAFVGLPRILDLYRLALSEGYRFYSYGDAMLLTDHT